MTRVLVSLLNFRPGRIGGAETYLRELLPRLPAAGPQDRFLLLARTDNAAEITAPGLEVIPIAAGDRAILRGRCWEAFTPFSHRAVRQMVRKLRPDVVFFPQQSMFPKRVEAPCVVTVHDLQHLVFPHYFSPFTRAYRRRSYGFALERADRLIAVSEFTRQELVARCGVPPERIITVRHGAPETLPAVIPSPPVSPPYLYCPAATFPHKGHAQLFAAIAELRDRGRFPWRVVLSGEQTRNWQSLKRLRTRLRLDEIVTHLGFVSRETVWSLYRHAEAVLFPSEYEGFGLPVLEAARAGAKIIASRLPVFTELGLPAQCQIDFRHADELAQALAQPGARMAADKLPTWSECAAQTVAVLHAATASR